ncbi:MAG TPA: hypothetical protein VKN36_03795 [Eudoraea sp.]|nr:hypothetical protein [Eudoraea sp.]
MQLLEYLLLFNTVLFLFVLSFFGRRRSIQKVLLLLGTGIFILHTILETPRWQMAFVYLIFSVLGLLYFKKSIAPLFLRISGSLLAMILLGISVVYSIGMPVLALKEPPGPYPVGHIWVTLLDNERHEPHSGDSFDKRSLLLEVWYPGKGRIDGKPMALWSGLYSGKKDIIHFFTNYLQEVPTHSFPDLEPAKGRYPLILFNHGLQMFTGQNTLLMEHLASNGYIVASIGHPYESIRVDLGEGKVILPEFISSLEKFREGMQWIAEASAPIEEAQKAIASLTDPEERGNLVLAAIEHADAINETVVTWTRDSRFVLDRLLETSPLSASIPAIDTVKIGIMGMSVGGAVAGEFCKVDPRVAAGINMDGLQYGTTQKDSLQVPFMMFASDDGQGMNDFMFLRSKHAYFEYHLRGTKHADLTDMAIIWPILKYYGQSGVLPSERTVEIVHSVILDFWDHYLKGRQNDLSSPRFPELTLKTNHFTNSE